MLKRGAAALTCVLTLLLGGCGSDGEAQRSAGGAVDVAGVLDDAGSGGAGLSSDDRLFVEQAVDLLTQRCVAKSGLVWPLPQRVAEPETRFPSPEILETSGYPISEERKRNLADRKPQPEGSEELREALFGLADAPTATLQLPDGAEMGTYTTGCVAEATTQIYGSVEKEFVVNTMRSYLWGLDAENAVISRQPYQDALATWRACMEAASAPSTGQAVSGMQAVENLYRRGDTPEADRQAARLARADATCLRSSGLYAQHERLVTEHRSSVTSSYGFSEAALVAAEREAFERARELTRG